MEQKVLDYEIDDVGGVEHLTLQLRPGVSVLRGKNAIGKTSAIQAVTLSTPSAVLELARRSIYGNSPPGAAGRHRP